MSVQAERLADAAAHGHTVYGMAQPFFRHTDQKLHLCSMRSLTFGHNHTHGESERALSLTGKERVNCCRRTKLFAFMQFQIRRHHVSSVAVGAPFTSARY